MAPPINVAGVVRAVEQAAADTVAETVAALEAEAKKQLDVLVYSTPSHGYRRTGNLINSVRSRVLSPTEGEVRASAAYARFVHDGTSRVGPRPFLTNAVRIDRPRLQARLERNVRRRLT